MPPSPACSFEPLDRLARFSWDWAPALCDPAHGCVDYHRSWSLVRLLELEGALPAGLAFLTRELAPLAAKEEPRVLVSGGADTGVCALVLTAMRAHSAVPDIVFADQCRTTCWQNSLFLRELGVRAEVLAMDAARVDCAKVDAVVAHSFLHFLPGPKRYEVLRAWARVLRPGGRVLMSCALSEDESDWVRLKDLQEVDARRNTLEIAAGAAGFEAEASEMAETAARFWATSPGKSPALTEANVRRDFADAGLDVVSIGVHSLDGARGPMALTTRETSRRERAEIVAVRR
jgi:SAM-dependent methyltransferase